MMSRDVADRAGRVVQGEHRAFFYNPMWSLMGDASLGPPGTYYYSGSAPITYFWNTFDQVLLRPSLTKRFVPGDVRVLDVVGGQSLLTGNGVPDKARSDHLPLVATVNLEDLTDAAEESLG
jgi:hypothetical protein